MSPAFGRMCASLVLSEGGESPAKDAGSTAQLGDDPLCWKKADLSPEVRVAEEPGKHESQGRIQKWQEGWGRAGQPRIQFWILGEGVGQGVLNCRGLRIHQEEDAAGGGRKPRRNGTRVMDFCVEAGSRSCGHPWRRGLCHMVSRPVGAPRAPCLCLSSFLPQLVAAKRVLVKTLKFFLHKFPPRGLRLVGKGLW